MDFNLTEEQELIKKTAKQFCKNEIEPVAGQLDRDGKLPDNLLSKYADMGMYGMAVPKEYGGTEAGDFAHLLTIEELAYAGSPAWWPVAFNNSLPQTICHFGTHEQKAKWVKSGLNKIKLFSIQFTEPDTGSDPEALLTTAKQDGDFFIINGQKRFSTFGARPGNALIWAKDEAGECTCFIIEKFAPGYSAPKIWDLMGSGGVEPADVFYNDYRAHKSQVLGERGKGLGILLYWISIEKLEGCIAAVALGQAALDEAINYAKNRMVRGKPMSDMQNIRFDFAEMHARIQACRWMVYRTAHLMEKNPAEFQKEASACKIFVQPSMSDVIATALRIHGGYGYTKDFKIERLYRAQPGNVVISVSLEINKTIVGASLLR